MALLPSYFLTYLFYWEQVIWGRARNKTTHFGNMLFIRRTQMFILPPLCESSWINIVFVSEVNKTTMAHQNRGDGDASEMWLGSLWALGHNWGGDYRRGGKKTKISYIQEERLPVLNIRFRKMRFVFSLRLMRKNKVKDAGWEGREGGDGWLLQTSLWVGGGGGVDERQNKNTEVMNMECVFLVI